MINRFRLLLLLVFIVHLSINAQWVSLKSNVPNYTEPNISLLSDNEISSIIKVELSGFEIKEFSKNNKTYQRISLLTDAAVTEVGSPDVPYISKVLAVPNDASFSIEVISHGEIQKFQNINIPPARKSWFEGQPETPYIENVEMYNSKQSYPQNYAEVGTPSIFRDFRIVRVAIYPVRYIPSKKELEVVSSITVKINYKNGNSLNLKSSAQKSISPSFASLYRNFIFNYESVLARKYNGREDGREVMLCIVPDELYESFLTYSDWQHKSGTYMHVTKFSDIGANATNASIIKNHISDAYFNWEFPPTYVLLVGDSQIFPKQFVYYDYTFPNEDYFVEVDGNDFFPEMMVGRFTNQGDYRMRVMINKYMNYERHPYTENPDWFTSAIMCSNNAYESQITTKRFAANILFDDGRFTHVDTVMSKSPCPADVPFIIGAINEGRSYLNYRGEGWSSGWWANCYSFGSSDVNSLNNGEMLTFVTSIGCGVAMFNASGGNCFGETWVQLGSLTGPRGGVAFVGPTSNTHTTYNNRIDKGIYVGMFQEGMDTPGQALLRGKLYMYNVFGNVHWVEYHYRVYCVLGDPSINVWKEFPRSINVAYNNEIPVGYNQVEFSITDSITDAPVIGAEICLVSNDVYVVDYTDENGNVLIPVTPEQAGTMSVVVRGGDVYPVEGNIEIIVVDENVAPDGVPVLVDLQGNNDGLINPNEDVQITYTLKNWGLTTADSIVAMLSTKDTNYISISNSGPVHFGDLNPSASFTGESFLIHIKETCPVDTTVEILLFVQSSRSSWKFSHKISIDGCELKYVNSLVDDDGSDNRNYRLDPDETAKIYMTISNIGKDFAPNVTGILRSDDPFITIYDSVSVFGSIQQDSAYTNLTDYFEVYVDSTFENEIEANFSVVLSTSDGFYPYTKINNFTLPNGNPVQTDPTGPDAYGYYAYSSDDVFFLESPAFNWIEIKDIGTELVRSEGESDFTRHGELPFTFRYYGIDYTSISINSDGWIAFGPEDRVAPVNVAVPNVDSIECMAAVFWDNLFSTNTFETGKIFYYYDSEQNRFIIQWNEVGHFSDYTNKETFQIILYDPQHYPTITGDGEFIFQYYSISEGETCTIGIENETEDVGFTLLHNNAYDQTATLLRSEHAIKFTTEEPTSIITEIRINEIEEMPSEFNLSQNYPNPFNPSTKIEYSIPSTFSSVVSVKLKVYDVLGSEIATLINKDQTAGKYQVTFNTESVSGGLPSGVYFYQIVIEDSSPGELGNFIQTKKLVLLK